MAAAANPRSVPQLFLEVQRFLVAFISRKDGLKWRSTSVPNQKGKGESYMVSTVLSKLSMLALKGAPHSMLLGYKRLQQIHGVQYAKLKVQALQMSMSPISA